MKFGYTIVYVPDVDRALEFFEAAFGLNRRFLHESGMYGELETGSTTLAFAAFEVAEMNLPLPIVRSQLPEKPLGFEIALVTDDVAAAHEHAVRNGAIQLSPPETKPWGQTVSYVRTPEGILVELCTPVTG